jgi:hypothetical protein
MLVFAQPLLNPRSFQTWFVWGPRVEKLLADDPHQRKALVPQIFTFDRVVLTNKNQITRNTFTTLFPMVLMIVGFVV